MITKRVQAGEYTCHGRTNGQPDGRNVTIRKGEWVLPFRATRWEVSGYGIAGTLYADRLDEAKEIAAIAIHNPGAEPLTKRSPAVRGLVA